MTENEEKRPKIAIVGGGRGAGRILKAHIELLEELEAYRAIGTVEGFKRAIESSIENYNLYREYKAKVQEFETIGTIEEFKALKEKEHNYDNCHNYTCRKKCEKDGYARAIDEFANQLKKKYEHCVVNDILMNNDVMSYTNSCSVFESFIDEIAEEMRGAV